MHHWIGQSVVAAVAGLVILSASVSKRTVDDVVISTVQMRAGKKAVLDFAAALERDIRNIGANFPGYEMDPDSAVIQWKTDSTFNYFEFMGQPAPGAAPALIRYQWEVIDTLVVQGEDRPIYQISRYVNGVRSGYLGANFTSVTFSLLADDGLPTSLPEEVRQIDVKVMAVSSLGSSETIRETRWNAVYRPQAIAREDNDDA